MNNGLAAITETVFSQNNQIINVKDLNLTGVDLVGEPGKPFVLSKSAAISNALQLWLLSEEGDYTREPSKGGVLPAFLGRPLTENTASQMYMQVVSKFNAEMSSQLELIDLKIVPNPMYRCWDITLKVSEKSSGAIAQTTASVAVN